MALYRVPSTRFNVVRLITVYVYFLALQIISRSVPHQIIMNECYSFVIGIFLLSFLIVTWREQHETPSTQKRQLRLRGAGT